jgi:hypothetical protein
MVYFIPPPQGEKSPVPTGYEGGWTLEAVWTTLELGTLGVLFKTKYKNLRGF